MTIPEHAFDIVARFRASKIQPYAGPQDRVLEYGVGNGVAMAYLRCGERHGFDVNSVATAEAQRRGINIVPSLDNISGRYDVAFAHHCLEHVINPAETLTTLRRVLVSNGTLLLFVPYEEQRRYRRRIANDPNHHLYSWTPHTLANLVEECGFTVSDVGLGRFGYDRRLANIAVRLGLGARGFHAMHRVAHLLRREREVRLIARV